MVRPSGFFLSLCQKQTNSCHQISLEMPRLSVKNQNRTMRSGRHSVCSCRTGSMIFIEQMTVWIVYYYDRISCRLTMIKTTKKLQNNQKPTEVARSEERRVGKE